MNMTQLVKNQNLYWISLTVFVVIFLVYAVGIRIIFLAHPITIDNNDSRWHYDPLARNLLQGHGYSKSLQPPYIPDSFHQPGYPLFLAANYAISGYSLQVVGYVQALLEVGILYMIWQLGGRLGLSRRARVAAVVFGLATPLLPRFNREILTEILATFAITLTVLLIGLAINKPQMNWRWILAGISGGIVLLIRADLLPSIILLILITVILNRHWHKVALLLLFLFVIMSPWMLRNYTIYEQLKPLGDVTAQTQLPYVKWLDTWLTDYAEEREYWHKRDPDPSIDYTQLIKTAHEETPVRTFVWVPLLRIIRVWINQPQNLPTPWYWQPAYFITYLTLVFGFTGAILIFWQRQWSLLIPLAIVVGRSILPFMSALGVEPRYMLEAIPMVYLLCGFSYDHFYRTLQHLITGKNIAHSRGK
jgi:4-amino-4-deoxy-L-arabinose transferase-like glycosyltransferase